MKRSTGRGLTREQREALRAEERLVKAQPQEDPYADLREVARKATGERRPRLRGA